MLRSNVHDEANLALCNKRLCRWKVLPSHSSRSIESKA